MASINEGISGLPVVGFNTGSLSELVSKDGGELVDYKSDPWKVEMPEIPSLIEAIEKVAKNVERYSVNTRKHAVNKFGVDDMASSYLDIFKATLQITN